MIAQVLDEHRSITSGLRDAAAQDDERDDALTRGLIRGTHHGGFGHVGVRDECGLDLGGRDAVPGHVHDVIHAPQQPQCAIGVELRAVTCEVPAGEPRPVGLLVALGVTPDAAEHSRPRLGQHEVPAAAVADGATLLIDHVGRDSGERAHRGSRLGAGHAGQRGDHDAARLGLPPGVDDRARVATDHLAVPHPRLGVDRFAHRSEQAKRGQILALRQVISPLHERADRGGGGVQDRDLVALDDVPPAILLGGVGRSLVHDLGHAVGERAVDDVRVAGDPADVSSAPVHVSIGFQIEHVAMRVRDLGEVATTGVQDALGLTRGARGVEDEERVLGRE